TYDDHLFQKYSNRTRWADAQITRLKQWGFNTLAEYPSYYMLPYPNAASKGTMMKLPSIKLFKVSLYSYTGRILYSGQIAPPSPTKDIVDCQGPAYNGYRGTDFPDVFDPNYETYIDGMLKVVARDPGERGHLTSPWALGVTADDSDDLFGFG